MVFGDIKGRAKVDPNAPSAFGVCDFGGEWRNRRDLHKQMEWQGPKLAWTGMLVCSEHMDKPQPQLKPIRIPGPDPRPVINPRPENFTTIDMPSGFTQYVMWPDGQPLDYGVVLMDGNGNPILDNYGNEILIEIGSDGVALLAQLSAMTGIAVPGNVTSYNASLTTARVAQQLVPANPTRSYIAIFNPCTAPIGVSVGTAQLGVAPTVNIGAGGCLFWATAQGFGPPYTGALTVAGNIPGVPFYAYDA